MGSRREHEASKGLPVLKSTERWTGAHALVEIIFESNEGRIVLMRRGGNGCGKAAVLSKSWLDLMVDFDAFATSRQDVNQCLCKEIT